MAWGNNSALQLGMETKTKVVKEGEEEFVEEEEQPENSDIPVPVQTLTGATAVAAGTEHSLALLGDGEVMAWGGNSDGQLGRGTQGGATSRPAAVSDLSGVTAIAAGAEHSLALLSGGTVVGWGYNPDGQLGDNSNLNSSVPVAVAGLGGVVGVSGGGAHSLSFGAPAATCRKREPELGPSARRHERDDHRRQPRRSHGRALRRQRGDGADGQLAELADRDLARRARGTVDVTVTTPTGTSGASAADKFSYVAPPAVAKLKPTKGAAAGGTSVTITGTALGAATAVSFGGTQQPASRFPPRHRSARLRRLARAGPSKSR